jgi:hypothetical protein
MDSVNKCINCDVVDCKFNAMGRNCSLNKIKVTGECSDGTCCGSFENK